MFTPWLQTHSGARLELLEPTPDMIDIRDVALGLSRTPRWNGQTKHFFSVAQHSLLVSQYAPPSCALVGLLHDASEAFLCDLPAPLKALCPDYCYIEQRVQAVVWQKFWQAERYDQSLEMSLAAVSAVDTHVTATEYRDLHPHQVYTPSGIPYSQRLECEVMCPEQAELAFLGRFHELYEGRSVGE